MNCPNGTGRPGKKESSFIVQGRWVNVGGVWRAAA